MNEARLRQILDRFFDVTRQDGDTGKDVLSDFADHIEEFFDDLMDDDYFGTEGQLHPFGDKRD